MIEVAKPVFYERSTDSSSATVTTTNTDYHHIPRTRPATAARNSFLLNMNDDDDQHIVDSSDDDEDHSIERSQPVTSTGSVHHRRSTHKDPFKQHGDSGIELDQTSSSSTICQQRPSTNTKARLSFSTPAATVYDTATTLHQRLPDPILDNDKTFERVGSAFVMSNRLHTSRHQHRSDRPWWYPLLIGLLILSTLFLVYFSQLDTCSRSSMIRAVCRRIICVEREGMPTF